MACHISPEWNLEDKVSVNEMEDEVFGDVAIESMDYERDWVREVNSKRRVWVVLSLFSPY